MAHPFWELKLKLKKSTENKIPFATAVSDIKAKKKKKQFPVRAVLKIAKTRNENFSDLSDLLKP